MRRTSHSLELSEIIHNRSQRAASVQQPKKNGKVDGGGEETTLREGGQASTSSRYMYTGWRVEWTIYSKLANKLCSASHKTFVLAQKKTAYHDHSFRLVCPVLSWSEACQGRD
ncbi:hypothetical protein ACLKA7_015434 [Drosophila subpalustris]